MSKRVLVVDDEDTIRGVIEQVLTDDGYEVIEASSGEEALDKFRNEPCDLVLTDIYMGKMTGLDLLKEVKILRQEAIVVVMTSNASLETAMTALRSGAYDYLIKPFEDIDLISAVVNRAIDRIQLEEKNRALLDDLRRNAQELENLNARLTDMANRDGLTGLYNHRYFREMIEQELSRSRRHDRSFSVLFIDIDHFKQYNDTYGHLAGDELLKTLARILQERCRSSTVAARYGGEEFVLLAPETDAAGAHQFAEILRDAVERYPFPGRETQPLGAVTLSLGLATFPQDGQDTTSLIDHADKALYISKHNGRNAVTSWEPAAV